MSVPSNDRAPGAGEIGATLLQAVFAALNLLTGMGFGAMAALGVLSIGSHVLGWIMPAPRFDIEGPGAIALLFLVVGWLAVRKWADLQKPTASDLPAAPTTRKIIEGLVDEAVKQQAPAIIQGMKRRGSL